MVESTHPSTLRQISIGRLKLMSKNDFFPTFNFDPQVFDIDSYDIFGKFILYLVADIHANPHCESLGGSIQNDIQGFEHV